MIGRDDRADFLFHSQKASRELIELITGESNQDKKTRLILRIMSRAKSIINDKIYKLKNKNDKPQEIDFTKENKIIIKCSNNLNDESQLISPDTPIEIKWIEFNLFSNSIDKSYIQQIQEQKIDIRLVDNIYNATHYYYSNGKDEDSDNFRIAIIRGIPVLNSKWLQLILTNNSEVTAENWLLNIDVTKWLPNDDQDYLPSSRINLFNDVKLVSTERIKWIDTIVIDTIDIEQELKKQVRTEEEFVFISDMPIDNLQRITKEQLWNCIKNNSIQGLPRNSIKFLKRPASEPAVEELHPNDDIAVVEVSPDRPKSRKRRRKYKKVDKLHFFSLANADPSPPPPTTTKLTHLVPVDLGPKQITSSMNIPQVRATLEVINTIDSDDTSNTKDFTPTLSDEGRSLPDSQDDNETGGGTAQVYESIATVENQLNEETPLTVRLESSQNESQSGEDSNHIGQKRKLESVIDKKPTKLGKFIPKVTLAEAVYQVKESNKPEIIELDKNVENLKNLTIVEVVDLIPRVKKNKIENNETLYSGRKNFKRFKKPEKKVSRRKVGLYTVEDKLVYRNNNQDQEDDEDDEDENENENELSKSSQFRVGHTTQFAEFETNETPKKRIGLFLNDDDDDLDED